jgi:RNA polymerase sigma-70 factor (ECF subfamily)
MPSLGRELVELLPRARRFAWVLTRSHADAEDVVQASIERALRGADGWTPGTRLDSWLFKIMQNVWRDELRAHRRRAEPLEAAAHLSGSDGRETTMRHLETLEAAAALAELPEDQRAVIALVVIEGLSYQGTADVLEIPVGTVMSRLARARARLAATLGDDDQRVRTAK